MTHKVYTREEFMRFNHEMLMVTFINLPNELFLLYCNSDMHVYSYDSSEAFLNDLYDEYTIQNTALFKELCDR